MFIIIRCILLQVSHRRRDLWNVEREEQLYEQFVGKHQGCEQKCHEKVTKEQIQARRKTMGELSGVLQRVAVIGILTVFLPVTGAERAHARYSFSADLPICREAFVFVNNTTTKTLTCLRKDICGGGFGVRRKAGYHTSTTKERILFILRYLVDLASVQGLTSPSPPRSTTKQPDIFLPSSLTRIDIWKRYKELLPSSSPNKSVSKSTFRKLWKEYLPHIKIRGLRTDICGACDDFFDRIYHARRNGIPYEGLMMDWTKHRERAVHERAAYVKRVVDSKTDYKVNNFSPSEKFPIGNDVKRVITFDYAQAVMLLHHIDQAGPIFFKVIFSIISVIINQQTCLALVIFFRNRSRWIFLASSTSQFHTVIFSRWMKQRVLVWTAAKLMKPTASFRCSTSI